MKSIFMLLLWAIIAYVVADKIGRNKCTGFYGSFALVFFFNIIGAAIVYFLPNKKEE